MQASSTSNGDPVEIRIVPERVHALRGIKSDMHIMLEIKTGSVARTKRPSIDLAIVLVSTRHSLSRRRALINVFLLG